MYNDMDSYSLAQGMDGPTGHGMSRVQPAYTYVHSYHLEYKPQARAFDLTVVETHTYLHSPYVK